MSVVIAEKLARNAAGKLLKARVRDIYGSFADATDPDRRTFQTTARLDALGPDALMRHRIAVPAPVAETLAGMAVGEEIAAAVFPGGAGRARGPDGAGPSTTRPARGGCVMRLAG
jgi:hypothetical protein